MDSDALKAVLICAAAVVVMFVWVFVASLWY